MRTLDEYQEELDAFLEKQQYDPKYWSPLSNLARLTEEIGEVARLLNHLYGDKPKRQDEATQELPGELGDVLFTLICIANQHGVSLSQAIESALRKAQTRDIDRFTRKK